MEPVEAYRLLMADVYELAGLSRRISGREASAYGTTAIKWHVLSALEDTPATVPQIALRLGLTRQGIQRVVNDLVASGHARTHRDDRAARSPRIEATREGRQLVAALWRSSRPPRQQALARAGINSADINAARAILRRLIEVLRESAG